MKKIIAVFALIAFGCASFACTTFCINKDGQIIFGRNYDWVTGAGIVNTNLRSLFKTSMQTSDGKTISWVSKYGSITFNQYGKEFPTGGMNEKGLVVELMWLDGTRYPQKDQRPSVDVLQWIQYQLDNSASVEQVIKTDVILRIKGDGTPLHYLVADANGNTAAIEFLNAKMVVHTGKTLPYSVLTNNTYDESVHAEKDFQKNNNTNYPGDNSLARFVKACTMVQQVNADKISVPPTDFAFSILNEVAQGSFTKWSIVYDITHKEIHFKTASNTDVKIIRFNGFDFSCSSSPKVFDMNQSGKADVTKNFTNFNDQLQARVLTEAIEESRSNVSISDDEKRAILNYTAGIKCN